MEAIHIIIASIISFIIAICTQIYLFIRGNENKKQKIKEIKEIINVKYLLIILAEIVLAVILFYNTSTHDNNILDCYKNMLSFLLVVPMAIVDNKEKIIPNKLVLAMLILWLGLSAVGIVVTDATIKSTLMFSLGGLAFGGGLFLICSVLIKGSVGMGDVKMFAVLGMIYGFNGLFSILFVTLFVLFVVCIVMLISKKADKKTTFPMAPYLLLGLVVSIFLGV